jgi:hypothetical protein
MNRTNILTKSKTITFDNNSGEYSGYSFQYIFDELLGWRIIDWLNGGYSNPVALGNFTINDDEYDTEFLNRGFTQTLFNYSKEKILQKLNIHLNEFRYKFENTEDIGIPYLEKPTADELDLFIKEAILSTIGVKEITSFNSKKVTIQDAGKYGRNKVSYYAEFNVKIETGENVWQSIAI